MYQHSNPTNSPLRRFGVATALGALLGAGGLFTLLPTAAHAEGDIEPPGIVVPEIFVEDIPLITIPDDDGPIFDGPIVTIPVIPGETPPDDTAPPAEQPPAEQPPAEQPDQPTAPPADDDAPTAPTGVAPFVTVTSATVDCAGMVHVTYETGATPALAPENEHVVMFSPASNPAAVTSQRLFQRPVNGVFTVDLQSPAAEAYRVLVVADFEPSNLEGVVLVDEADAATPVDCA